MDSNNEANPLKLLTPFPWNPGETPGRFDSSCLHIQFGDTLAWRMVQENRRYISKLCCHFAMHECCRDTFYDAGFEDFGYTELGTAGVFAIVVRKSQTWSFSPCSPRYYLGLVARAFFTHPRTLGWLNNDRFVDLLQHVARYHMVGIKSRVIDL